jgi:hypothetical protein
LNESSSMPISSSDGIIPSGRMPCSRQSALKDKNDIFSSQIKSKILWLLFQM